MCEYSKNNLGAALLTQLLAKPFAFINLIKTIKLSGNSLSNLGRCSINTEILARRH